MLILLPPSETKRTGGDPRPIDLGLLALPSLRPQRDATIDALVELSRDEAEAARVLGLSPRQLADVQHNAALRHAPTMAALDRYTGVLYDALAAAHLPAPARRWLGRHVLIHSAPFGLIGALDRIPSYRLAAGTAVPGIPPLRRLWADAVTAALDESGAAFVLDLRSEAYVALGPVPSAFPSAYVRVVVENQDGTRRALSHFNKHAKGALVRRLAQERPRISGPASLMKWAHGGGVELRPRGVGGTWELVVDS